MNTSTEISASSLSLYNVKHNESLSIQKSPATICKTPYYVLNMKIYVTGYHDTQELKMEFHSEWLALNMAIMWLCILFDGKNLLPEYIKFDLEDPYQTAPNVKTIQDVDDFYKRYSGYLNKPHQNYTIMIYSY